MSASDQNTPSLLKLLRAPALRLLANPAPVMTTLRQASTDLAPLRGTAFDLQPALDDVLADYPRWHASDDNVDDFLAKADAVRRPESTLLLKTAAMHPPETLAGLFDRYRDLAKVTFPDVGPADLLERARGDAQLARESATDPADFTPLTRVGPFTASVFRDLKQGTIQPGTGARSGEAVVFVVDGAGANIFDHTGIAVRGPDGKLVYYDVQAESSSNPLPKGSVNKYNLPDLRRKYGDRNLSYTVVEVPDFKRLNNALEVAHKLWGKGGYGYDALNRNCVGFVCDSLYKGGYEVKRIPGNLGENPLRYPNDLEQSLRYFSTQPQPRRR